MALSDAQKARIRRLVGDNAGTVFSDPELDQYYTDVGDDFWLTVIECIDVLLADAAKQVSYRQGASFEDDNKLFEHLEKVRKNAMRKRGVTQVDLTHEFYDEDGTDIPYPEADDDYGWMIH